MGPKKMQMEEKSRALTLLEKGDSVIILAKDIGVAQESIYQANPNSNPLQLINSLFPDTNIFR